MKSQIVEYRDDDVTAQIKVVRANFGQELDRSDMILQAESIDEPRSVRRYVHKVLRPALLAATASAQIQRTSNDLEDLTWPAGGVYLPWPIGFEDLLDLPTALVDRWTDAVYALNPSWNPQRAEAAPEAVEKKAPNSTSD